jgi:hypothetical protein
MEGGWTQDPTIILTALVLVVSSSLYLLVWRRAPEPLTEAQPHSSPAQRAAHAAAARAERAAAERAAAERAAAAARAKEAVHERAKELTTATAAPAGAKAKEAADEQAKELATAAAAEARAEEAVDERAKVLAAAAAAEARVKEARRLRPSASEAARATVTGAAPPAPTPAPTPLPSHATIYAPRTAAHGQQRTLPAIAAGSVAERMLRQRLYANARHSAQSWVASNTNDGSLIAVRLRPGNVPAARRVTFAIAFPEGSELQPRFFTFDKTRPMGDIRTVIKSLAGGGMGEEGEAGDERRFMVGSPARLNLFSLASGRLLRPDLEVEAQLGTDDVCDGDVLVLEQGNRLPPERVEAVRRFMVIER